MPSCTHWIYYISMRIAAGRQSRCTEILYPWQGDVFDYLLKDFNDKTEEWEDSEDGAVGGILGSLFANEHYNGDPITSDDRG